MREPERERSGLNAGTVMRELAYPARSLTCLLTLLVFWVLAALAFRAGLFGIWLLVILMPALCRFLVALAEARAAGREVETPGIESFTLAGNGWALAPVAWLVALSLIALPLADERPVVAWSIAIVGASAWPAMLGVLVITHSPLQALNPGALVRFVRHAGPAYVWVSAVLVLACAGGTRVAAAAGGLGVVVVLYCLFAVHALAGALVRESALADAVDVPEDDAVHLQADALRVARERKLVLNHAYALFSRGNPAGALAHLRQWLAGDPDPVGARAWFQAQMLGWEGPLPALAFGAEHLSWLLAAGERVRAVKLMLRLRLADPAFRPAAADLPAAIAAARTCGNGELAEALATAPEAPARGL